MCTYIHLICDDRNTLHEQSILNIQFVPFQLETLKRDRFHREMKRRLHNTIKSSLSLGVIINLMREKSTSKNGFIFIRYTTNAYICPRDNDKKTHTQPNSRTLFKCVAFGKKKQYKNLF